MNYTGMVCALEVELEYAPDSEVVGVFNTVLEEHDPATAESMRAATVGQVATRRAELQAAAAKAHPGHVPSDGAVRAGSYACDVREGVKVASPLLGTHWVCGATKESVLVNTDVGEQEMVVPGTTKQRDALPDAEQWRQADEKALDVLLRAGNVLVPVSKPRGLGLPIHKSVLNRRIKTDPATGRMLAKNGRKSRLCKDGGQEKRVMQSRGIYVPRGSHAENAGDMEVKMLLARAAMHGMTLLKLDIGNAYCKAKSRVAVSYLDLGLALERSDESGEKLCLELHTRIYGEETAGDDWDADFSGTLKGMGWEPAESVPALHVVRLPEGTAVMVRIVDDVLMALPPSREDVGQRTVLLLKEAYGDVDVEWEPSSFLGYRIHRPDPESITITMASYVEQAVADFCPEVAGGGKLPSEMLRTGESLQRLADGLTAEPVAAGHKLAPDQKTVQRVLGALRYPERCMPVLTLGLHRLSCVQANPPPEALTVAKLMLELAFEHRHTGLTYSASADAECARVEATMGLSIDLADDSAPRALTGFSDASWTGMVGGEGEAVTSFAEYAESGRELVPRDLYSEAIVYGGALIHQRVKRLGLHVDCSMAAEGIGTSRLAETISQARDIDRAMGGAAMDYPATLLATDNRSSMQVAQRQGAASRARHLLRRYAVLLQRVKDGEVVVRHVPDASNPADFLTKFVSARKMTDSLRYLTGVKYRSKGLPTCPVSNPAAAKKLKRKR